MVDFTTHPADIVPGDIIGDPNGCASFVVLAPAEPVEGTTAEGVSYPLYTAWIQSYRGPRLHLTIDGPVCVVGHMEGSPSDPHGRQSITHWDGYDCIQSAMRSLNA